MKSLVYALVAGIAFLPGLRADELPRAAPKTAGLSAERLGQIKTIVQSAVDKKQTAGVVVLVARHGKIVYEEAFGKRDVEADKPMAVDSLFRIYSMSKPITSVAALMLVEEGKIKLDNPVSQYLPDLKGVRVYAKDGETVEAKREMMIRDLLRHTSGLTYGFFGLPVDKLYNDNRVLDPNGTLADMVRKLGKLPLQYQPGTKFNYSVSTDVLGRVIEVVSGQPLDEFFREHIFKPLDMHDTSFVVPADKADRLTGSYLIGDKGLSAIDAPATSTYRKPATFLSGGGGLVSTARDYARFCQMLLNGGEFQGRRLLRSQTVQEMTENQLPPEALPMTLAGFPQPGLGFGLGVQVKMPTKSEKPDPAAGEYSWSGAASSYFWVAPKSEMTVIVMQQIQPFNFVLQLALKPLIYSAIEE